MRHYPRADLIKPIEDSLRGGNPWIYADAIRHQPGRPGDIVDIYDTQGQWLGRGVLDPNSPIRVRLWTLMPQVDVNNALLEQRIRAARRRRPFPTAQTTGFRLLNGEGDRLPGLVCDIYGDLAVLRPDGEAAERWITKARQVIGQLLPIKHWALRRSRRHAQNKPVAQWLTDPPQHPLRFLEDGLTYEIDPIQGQKTGFFLDQRASRARLASYCPGKRLLNLFGYTGGFSLAAAARGAAKTTTVDIAAPAIDAARKNFELNHIPASAHDFAAADVFDFLEQFAPKSAPFEVVVCDPPSFAHRQADLPRASTKYRELFAKIFTIMPAQATIALASCSSHIDRPLFRQIITEAAQDAQVSLVLAGVFGADIDHPTLPGFPEGDYLQFALGSLERD